MGTAAYSVYMVQCADGTYYIGVARDVAKRVREHNEGPRGAKYTKARRPVVLVYHELADNRSQAQQREHALRQLTRDEKSALVHKAGKKSGAGL